jgi:hypothetical protein
MKSIQASRGHAAMNRTGPKADLDELSMRDDPMLALGYLCHPPFTWAGRIPNTEIETAHVGHGREDGLRIRTEGARIVRNSTRPKGEMPARNLRPVSKDVPAQRI